MILYHFTALQLLPRILAHGGLERGDVILGQNGESGINAVWLTTNENASHCGACDGTETYDSPPEWLAAGFPPVVTAPDKRAIRIAVNVPARDRNLQAWLPFVTGQVGQHILDYEFQQAGGERYVQDWHIYKGLIPTRRFERVEIRDGNSYRLTTPAEIAAIEPFEIGWVAPKTNILDVARVH